MKYCLDREGEMVCIKEAYHVGDHNRRHSKFAVPEHPQVLPCVVCRKSLKPAFSGVDETTPYAGTSFTSHGHYGSTVWDPTLASRSYLELTVCDDCLLKAREEGVVYLVDVVSRPEVTKRSWTSADDERY